ncbi:MAG: hypothetical protein WCK02_05055 [Bacteroidota bacterium]
MLNKKFVFVSFILIQGLLGFSQIDLPFFKEKEDSLIVYGKLMLNAETDDQRVEANQKFKSILFEALKKENSFQYNFDSLLMIARLMPEDKSFRLYNWHINKSNGTYLYFGVIQVFNEKKKKYDIYWLSDKTMDIMIPQEEKLGNDKWYGAHYYKVIENKDGGKKYYTLLGWKGNNQLTQKKVIDVLLFNSSGKPTFGDAIFKVGKKPAKRVVFEYSSTVSMTMKYHEKTGYIVYDHLSPKDDNLKGQFQYYGPDFTYDALKFKNGKWHKVDDFEARNDDVRYTKKDYKKDLKLIKEKLENNQITKDMYLKEVEVIERKLNRKPQKSSELKGTVKVKPVVPEKSGK